VLLGVVPIAGHAEADRPGGETELMIDGSHESPFDDVKSWGPPAGPTVLA
jgi:hypothetical protein